jgi:hypothetical protein
VELQVQACRHPFPQHPGLGRRGPGNRREQDLGATAQSGSWITARPSQGEPDRVARAQPVHELLAYGKALSK